MYVECQVETKTIQAQVSAFSALLLFQSEVSEIEVNRPERYQRMSALDSDFHNRIISSARASARHFVAKDQLRMVHNLRARFCH
jgi:hypothetical protein